MKRNLELFLSDDEIPPSLVATRSFHWLSGVVEIGTKIVVRKSASARYAGIVRQAHLEEAREIALAGFAVADGSTVSNVTPAQVEVVEVVVEGTNRG